MAPRILFITSTTYDDLRHKGVDATLLDRDEHGYFERVVSLHPFSNKTQTIELSNNHRLYEISEYFLPFCSGLKFLRYPHHLIHFLRLIIKVHRIISSEKIGLIRATEPTTSGILGWIAGLLTGIPFCLSIHADYDKCFQLNSKAGGLTIFGSRKMAKILEGFIYKRADWILPIRSSLINQVTSRGISLEKIRVIPHGIDFGRFQKNSAMNIKQIMGIPENLRILSFVGRLSKENYVYDLIGLAEALKKQRNDFVVVLMGDGPERKGLETKIKTLGLEKFVLITGFRPQDAVISLRKESAVALCLMGGFSLIEACAAARPVIAYDVEWHSELVVTGQTGFLVPENDLSHLAESINLLLDHPNEAERMGKEALARSQAKHDAAKATSIKRQVYDEILGIRKNSRS